MSINRDYLTHLKLCSPWRKTVLMWVTGAILLSIERLIPNVISLLRR